VNPYEAPYETQGQTAHIPAQPQPVENYAYGPYIPVEITAKTDDKSGQATTGMVLGIIALVLSFVPLVGMISWILGPLAIIFGVLGRGSSKKGQAKAGWICGAIAVFICMCWVGLLIEGIVLSSGSDRAACISAAQTLAQMNACG
jgi:hypothetical protein